MVLMCIILCKFTRYDLTGYISLTIKLNILIHMMILAPADYSYTSSQARHKGPNEEQVCALSKVEAMDNIYNKRHGVWNNWEGTQRACDMERTSIV